MKMKAFRENLPYIFGFVAYWTYYIALLGLIWLGISFLFLRYFSRPSDYVYLLLYLGIQGLIGYLGFIASVRWIVLPLLKRSKNIPVKTGREFLVLEWLLLLLFVFLYGKLPTIFLHLLPIAKEVQNVISFVWITMVSFALYKDTVSSYAFSSPEEKLASENDHQAKVI